MMLMKQPSFILSIIKRRQPQRRWAQYPATTAAAVKNGGTTVAVVQTAEMSNATYTTTATSTAASGGPSKMGIALFATYFCNMAVVASSVVTIPALADEHFATIGSTAGALTSSSALSASAFVAGVAGMAPLGGAIGKIINGFVCQRFGGRTTSWTYLLALAGVNGVMSLSSGLAAVGPSLMVLEFLSSIQWTSICHILDYHYRSNPRLMAKGIALLSLSSTLGALAAKTVGVGLLQTTGWRNVCRLGSVVAIVGAAAMYFGVDKMTLNPTLATVIAVPKQLESDHDSTNVMHTCVYSETRSDTSKSQSPLLILISILTNKTFWMVGMANSLGYLARGSDRILGPFLQEAASLSSPVAAVLTSSVTVGFVGGIIQGSIFSKIESVKSKMKMIRQNYLVSLLSILGLACSAVGSMTHVIGGSNKIVAAAITVFSGIMASTVSFQFYLFPNLVSSNVFPESSAVSLSLLDAAGFFFTAQILAANSRILWSFGWSASWSFLAIIFGLGGTIMSRAIQPVLVEAKRKHRCEKDAR